MTAKKKKLLLDLCGAFVTVLFPGVAAVVEFPNIRTATSAGTSFMTWLNISTTAFSVIAVIAALTAWRFCRDRLKLPKSGLFAAFVLWILVRGIRLVVEPFETILFWATIGCAVAWVLYLIAEKKYGGEEQ